MLVAMVKSVAYASPILDAAGRKVIRTVVVQGFEQKVEATENIYCFAKQTYDVPKKVAQEWIEAGLAREADPDFDDLGPANPPDPGAGSGSNGSGADASGNA